MPKGARGDDEAEVVCPYCNEEQLLIIDPSTEGEFVQDCDVCCRPWNVWVDRDDAGALEVSISRAQ